uniref:Uncharacterized protein n=1 Tax=Anguilla anguilla TaxID=7936 RepID=A0A0E9WCQ4_ANGAN
MAGPQSVLISSLYFMFVVGCCPCACIQLLSQK